MIFDAAESEPVVPSELTLDNGSTAWIRMPFARQ
ncbi:MAG: hypothetical protein ACJATT_004685 [Myxococcota bacterium]|jgi:hypothetical protein